MSVQRDTPAPRLVTIEQLRAAWQCSEGFVRKLMDEGRLPCVRVGRFVRFAAEWLDGPPAGPTVLRAGREVQVRG
jgi:excisionase family DNA binding protein